MTHDSWHQLSRTPPVCTRLTHPQRVRVSEVPSCVVAALRPVLLGAAAVGVCPLSAHDGTFRWCSTAALLTILVTLVTVALTATRCLLSSRPCLQVTSALDTYTLAITVIGYLQWTTLSMCMWMTAHRLQNYFEAWKAYADKFGAPDVRRASRRIRRLGAAIVVQLIAYAVYEVLFEIYSARSNNAPVSIWVSIGNVLLPCITFNAALFCMAIYIGVCWCLTDAFDHITASFRAALPGDSCAQLRQLVLQHGHVSMLADRLCSTCVGLIATTLYLGLFIMSLSIYIGTQPRATYEQQAIETGILQHVGRFFTPVPFVFILMATEAGHSCVAASSTAGEVIKEHQLAGQAAEQPWVEQLQRKLVTQQVNMDVGGYLRLDREFFVQSVKDFITLLIVFIQFDQMFP